MQAAASQKRLWGAHCRKAFAEGGQYLRTMRSASAFGFHIVSIENSKPRNWTKNGSAHESLKLRSGDFCSSKLSFHGWWFSVCDIVVAMCLGVIWCNSSWEGQSICGSFDPRGGSFLHFLQSNFMNTLSIFEKPRAKMLSSYVSLEKLNTSQMEFVKSQQRELEHDLAVLKAGVGQVG